eukprot:comp21584_c0_seq1/m.30170 comp21584_c0_seq1/g.30170  ORF comp21584_c0_seq1/g.30170 comp21584_c0_seq1/m.30170 type:complete len:197 (-) comp21584_c0_seq1:409-999(-)
MKFWETQHTFSHPWEKVTEASWRKYNNQLTPTLCPHILSVDVIDRKVQPDGVMSTTRLISVVSNIPSWLGPLFGFTGNKGFVYEVSEVDSSKKSMVLRSQNITLANLLTVEETCTYTVDPDDPNKTQFNQECCVTANFARFAHKAETAMVERFQSTALKGKETMEKVCQLINQEQRELAAEISNMFTPVPQSTNEI